MGFAVASCLTGGLAHAAVTLDATSQTVQTIGATSLTFSHILGTGPSRLMVCGVQIANPTTPVANVIPTVTINGISMTAIAASQAPSPSPSTSRIESEMFYINDSSLGSVSGSVTVQVTLPGAAPTGGVGANCASFFGVAQTAPDAVGQGYNGSGTPPSVSASLTTTVDGDLIVDSFAGGFNLGSTGKSATPNQGTPAAGISNQQNAAGGILSGASYELVGTAGAYAPGWTYVVSRAAYSAVAFAPAPPAIYTITTTVSPAGGGAISLSPSQANYSEGTSVTVTATPATNYTFTGFTGDLNSATNPSTIVMDNNKSITANFVLQGSTCALTTVVSGQGTVTPSSGSYPCGSTINLTATPSSGNNFGGWSGSGYTGSSSSASFTLTQDTTETATFNPTTTCNLTTSVTGLGTISPSSGSYACGTQVTLYAFPAAHYLFGGWGGALTGNTTPATITLNTDTNVTATFDQNNTNVTGDARTVTEPVYPPVCSTLSAQQVASSLVETSADTTRVQAALNACTPGQAVEFSSSGTNNAFIIAPITLPPGVTMLVDPDVTIFGSIRYADYSCNTSASWCTPLINVAPNADPAPGSGIMGLGVIDGRGGVALTDKGESWWATGSDTRPRLIYLGNNSTLAGADNFTLYKITLKNTPKFHVSGEGNNLTVWGVRIIAPPDSPNTDGIDPSGSNNITITNSYISDGDDMIAPKAGIRHMSNISIYNNHFYSGHGISVGSETNGGLNNMYVHDNAFDDGFGGTSFDSLRIKSDSSRGGEVYDVLYKNTCINNGGDTFVFDPYYSSSTGSLIPNFHDITISNFHQLIRNSSFKSTIQGYNTNGIVYPATLTLDNVVFDGAVNQNDWKAPTQVNNAQITLGPGPVSIATFLTTDAAVATNNITLFNNISNSNPPLDCTNAFVYLTGDLTAPTNTATTGNSFTVTAMLQNVVSPPMSGTIAYPQQNIPTGTIQLLEGSTVVATAAIANGSRLTGLTVQAITSGTHTYTAQYLGDSNYAPLNFGTFTVNTSDVAAPVANNQSVNVNYNTATPVSLTATGAGTMVYTVVTAPAHGALIGTAPALTYTPASGYIGTDSFAFKANNGSDSNIATISITVAAVAPVANNQSVTTAYATATPVTLTATGNGTVTYTVIAAPANGTLSGTAPNLTYTPAAGFTGADSFTFKANNGADSNVATVSITVLAAPPVANNQSVTIAYNAATAITLNATGSGTLSYAVVGGPAHGTLSGTAPTLTYTPASGYSGSDSFTFKANNGSDSNVATVTLNVLPAAPVANNQSVTVAFNTAKAIALSATGSGTLSYTVASNPAHGTLSGTAPNLTYTPASGYAGSDSFTFKATNGTDSNIATVSITVLTAAPVASNQSVTVAFNTATPIALSATGSGTLVYTVLGSPAHGTLNGTAPNLTYTPASGYSGSDSFTFKASNGTDSNVATISITVSQGLVATPVNGGSLSATVTAGQPAVFNLQLSGWTGATGTVSFTCSGVPQNATCTISPVSATLNGTTAVPFTVTVATEATTSALMRGGSLPAPRQGKGMPAAFLAGLSGLIFGLRRRRSAARLLQAVILCIGLSAFCVISGCGSNSGSQSNTGSKASSGTYPLTVTATSAGVTQSIALTLIVK